MASIQARDLRYTYRGATAPSVSGADLDIEDGEAHALLGASGAGKTTLLNLLAGLFFPDSGQLKLNGEDVSERSGRERNIAQVFQFPVLYPAMNVRENLAFPLRARGWRKANALARVKEVATLLDVTALLHQRVQRLSLFEKQLVAIGRALVRPDVSVVLLDEPLTAVEPSIKWRLRAALKTVQRELGLTMVYVTHDQVEALTFADRISMLMDGRILQTGSPQRLYEQPHTAVVATFIGSPGMNLVSAQVRDQWFVVAGQLLAPAPGVSDGVCQIGFRPEWAHVRVDRESDEQFALPVNLTGWRAMGAVGNRTDALLTLDHGGETLFVHQSGDEPPPPQCRLYIDTARMVAYRNGVLLARPTGNDAA
ncbi:MAG: ABC transporter ATP-binding protein [Pseudomonadales bacterium]|nr:ABC transporter ATP-binding protein [Pseudomonadales bacterium]MDP6471484.1 ABC transporter ATP-binding protein [Pseudomonadales bacterium]MDP6828654.1 ABC transporter ATP-binding protein [Pseudomonadales bacterium]MDP6972372.1 ABC transporter ATP-binding protein [Pseudomonadales bacterium]